MFNSQAKKSSMLSRKCKRNYWKRMTDSENKMAGTRSMKHKRKLKRFLLKDKLRVKTKKIYSKKTILQRRAKSLLKTHCEERLSWKS